MSDSGDDDTPRTLVRKLIHLKPISSTPFTQHLKAVAHSSSRKIHLASRKPSLQHFLKTPYVDDEVTPKTLIKNVVQEKKQRGSSLYAFKQQHKLSTHSDEAVGRSNEMEDSLDSVQQEMMKEIPSAEDKDISNLSLESEIFKGHLVGESLVRSRKTKRIDLETFKAGLKELREKRGTVLPEVPETRNTAEASFENDVFRNNQRANSPKTRKTRQITLETFTSGLEELKEKRGNKPKNKEDSFGVKSSQERSLRQQSQVPEKDTIVFLDTIHPEETDLNMAHQELAPAVSARSQSQPSLKEMFPENYPDVHDQHSGDSYSTLEYTRDQSQSFEDPDNEDEQLVLEKSRPHITPTLRTPDKLYQDRKKMQSKKQQVKSKLGTSVKKKKPNNRLPSNLTRSLFEQFCGLKVTRQASELVELCCDQFFKNLSSDLMTYAKHAGRKTVQVADIELLLHRQRLITDQQSLYALVEKYLPLEYREKIVPMATVKNNVKP